MHTHTCTHAYTHTRIRAPTCMHTCPYASVHTHTHTCTQTYIYAHTCTHRCMHTSTHAHMHALSFHERRSNSQRHLGGLGGIGGDMSQISIILVLALKPQEKAPELQEGWVCCPGVQSSQGRPILPLSPIEGCTSLRHNEIKH